MWGLIIFVVIIIVLYLFQDPISEYIDKKNSNK